MRRSTLCCLLLAVPAITATARASLQRGEAYAATDPRRLGHAAGF